VQEGGGDEAKTTMYLRKNLIWKRTKQGLAGVSMRLKFDTTIF